MPYKTQIIWYSVKEKMPKSLGYYLVGFTQPGLAFCKHFLIGINLSIQDLVCLWRVSGAGQKHLFQKQGFLDWKITFEGELK
jgi:hypothetical protein